jgi:hypothetical protein
MKRAYLRLFAAAALIFTLTTGVMAQSPVPLYRSYSYDHLFTTSFAEQAWHQANLGYVPEGVESNVWTSWSSGRVPVFRLSRSAGGHLHHYYTTNVDEKNYLLSVAATGFSYDGVCCYVYNYPAAGTHPIYRVDRTYQAAQWFLWWQISPERSADSVLTMRNSERTYLLSHGYYENQTFGSLIGYANAGTLGFD